MPSEKLVPELVRTMDIAPREMENRAVLAVLGEQASLQALDVVVKNLENATLVAEAQAAVVGICRQLVRTESSACKAALEKLLQSNPNEIIEKQATQILQNLRRT